MKGKATALCLWIGVWGCMAAVAQGGYLTIYAGPMYDPNTGDGFKGGSTAMVNAFGTAVGTTTEYIDGNGKGTRGVRWDGSGVVMELGNLGTDPNGYTSAGARAINDAGIAVGYAHKWVAWGAGAMAVRWDTAGAAIELGTLGNWNGLSYSGAFAINAGGTAVGFASTLIQTPVHFAAHPARWDAAGTVTKLDDLGSDPNGFTSGLAAAINASGTVVGHATKYVGGGSQGTRGVRWEPGGTVATELGNLGTDSNGYAGAAAVQINASGTGVGRAQKYVGGTDMGYRAVRWEPGGTVATELGCLGTDPNGSADAKAHAINDAGTAVGRAQKYVGGTDMGYRAVRWEASATAATELGILGTDPDGWSDADADAINASGTIVGTARKYVGGVDAGYRAVYWGLDALPVDLNDLVDPLGGWTLTVAYSISDTDWIAGSGLFDPDGPGGFDAYERLYLLQIPEPGTVALLALGTTVIVRRRRRFRPPAPG